MTQKSANRGLIVVWFLLAILTGLVATVIARTRPVEVVVDLEHERQHRTVPSGH